MCLSRCGSRSCSRSIRSGRMKLRLSCTRACCTPCGFSQQRRHCCRIRSKGSGCVRSVVARARAVNRLRTSGRLHNKQPEAVRPHSATASRITSGATRGLRRRSDPVTNAPGRNRPGSRCRSRNADRPGRFVQRHSVPGSDRRSLQAGELRKKFDAIVTFKMLFKALVM